MVNEVVEAESAAKRVVEDEKSTPDCCICFCLFYSINSAPDAVVVVVAVVVAVAGVKLEEVVALAGLYLQVQGEVARMAMAVEGREVRLSR